jgi:hypothetical protein
LRLRTWHPSWPNLLFSWIGPWIFFHLLIATTATGSVNDGVFGSLERLIQSDRTKIRTLQNDIRHNPSLITALTQADQVNLHPIFMQSILLYSNPSYIHLLNQNSDRKKCIFYSLLENGMLNYSAGAVKDVIVQYRLKNGEEHQAILDRAEFTKIIYRKECPSNIDQQNLFSDRKIIETVTNTKFPIPRGATQCYQHHAKWVKNPFTSHLCKIPHTIQYATAGSFDLNRKNASTKDISRLLASPINHEQADLYRTKIPFFNLSYLFNLCQNLDSLGQFCYNYTKNTIWLEIADGKFPEYFLSHHCREMTKKSKIGAVTLKSCGATLDKNRDQCLKPSKDYPSLLKTSDCSEVSHILEHSNLVTDYHDCPGKIDNDGVTNVHRILMHIRAGSYPSNSLTCNSEANYSFFQLNQQFDNISNWPLQICYNDLATEEKKCLKYFSGNLDRHNPHSEARVVGRVLHNIRGAPSGILCKIIDKKSFNPNRLEHQNGCTVVYDSNNCTIAKCEKIVIYRKQVIKDITYEGSPEFYYFPSSYKNNKFSAFNMLQEVKRIGKRRIYNQTMLQRFIDYKKGNIVHGVGCVEDLHPSFFRRRALNGCRPIPFLIDGYINTNGEVKIILRSSISDIHNPTLITWNRIFSALMHYQSSHPLKTWPLFGISQGVQSD